MTNNDFIHKLFKENPLLWGYYFFADHFKCISAAFHLKILKTILNFKKTAICAPRGFSKSTLVNFLFLAWGIVFKRFRYIIILQASESKAMDTLATLKKEFTDNELLSRTYKLTLPLDTQRETVFRHPDGYETKVACYGREQMGKIRGSKFGPYRPDCVIADDLEDDELVRTRELREEVHRKFKDAVEPAIDISADYRIVYIDTMKHYDSQLAKMISKEMYTDFKKLHFPALYVDKDGNERSLWEERIPLEELKRLQREDPITFAKEMQGDPVTGDMASFDTKDFRRWAINDGCYVVYDDDGSILSKGELGDCRAAIGYDLAWEEKRRHDYTSIVPVLITPEGYCLVDTYLNVKGMKPDMLAEHMFALDDKYTRMTRKPLVHGFEKGKYEKVAKWYLTQEMKKRNKWLIIKDIPWVTDKTERAIVPLQPRYHNHAIFHRKNMGELETQLMRFPSGVHDDLVDALQIAVRQLTDAPKKPVNTPQSHDEKFKKLIAAFREDDSRKGQFSMKRRHSIPCIRSI